MEDDQLRFASGCFDLQIKYTFTPQSACLIVLLMLYRHYFNLNTCALCFRVWSPTPVGCNLRDAALVARCSYTCESDTNSSPGISGSSAFNRWCRQIGICRARQDLTLPSAAISSICTSFDCSGLRLVSYVIACDFAWWIPLDAF